MFENILVAHNGSDGGHRAFDAALKLALRLESRLHMISVIDKLPRHAEIMAEVEDIRYRETDHFDRLVAQARRRAAFHSVSLESSIVAGHPVKVIANFANPRKFDLLVVGTSSRPALFGQLWGGISHNLARVAPCSILLVR